MIVGYAVLYKDGTLVISKKHSMLSKKVRKDYGQFEDTNVPWKNEIKKIEKVHILDQIKSNCTSKWFEDCMNLTTLINFQNLDTSDCTNFSRMFTCCKSLQNINALQNWDVSNGTDFSSMFYSCESLQDLNELQNWDVSNGTNFLGMFYSCESLQDLNGLQNWNVSNGTDFSGMFEFCTLLNEIYLSNTLNILTKEMFNKCNKTLKIYWKNHIYIY